MASRKQRKGFDRAGAPAGDKASTKPGTAAKAGTAAKPGKGGPATSRSRARTAIAGAIVVAVVAIGAILVVAHPFAGSSSAAGTGTVVQASNGSWTNISPDTLAAELGAHDFTLLNVKTPYIGEIDGTDLYIPYTQLAARASELPKDKSAKIVVYCRSGNESAIAAQTLLNLGYTDIQNLDGGMNAWTASGRSIIQKNRT